MLQTSNGSVVKIGHVAKQLRIAVETIRMYEREGLFIPAKTTTGQRVFTEEDVHWMNCIRRLIKEQGLNLAGIRRLLALMPCWQIKPCSLADRRGCPAFTGATQPCWTLKPNLPAICRTADCRECQVYRSASDCTNLKTLLYKLQHKEATSSSTRSR
ncbi:MAG: MerR family transcriptional regulator [candidate division KSB1 bacterium]|nr:MerR family transcriptional regulator [candidate division KSB1 bacterium]MDZ7365383.1 MerR family transcriptional regulator [candidate division KSB1 bacterium]MDZ7403570.1 MerR family transcriptional regulator [candidate division KSB1 bacterium]